MQMKQFFFLILSVFFYCDALLSEEKPKESFLTWKANIIKEAVSLGISKQMASLALSKMEKPSEKVIALYNRQPEKTMSFSSYQRKIVSSKMITTGKQLLEKHRPLLQKISRKYQIPAKYLVSIWGIESRYGSYTGGFSVIDSLATLAYESRRQAFFKQELMSALRILDKKHIEISKMKGSWAGAMGQSQFMPSSFLQYAVDEDMDDKKDIWSTKADVLASIANYLKKHGWRSGERWGRKVLIPAGFKKELVGLAVRKSVLDWADLGLVTSDGSTLPKAKMMASVVLPDWKHQTAFLVYKNFEVILTYNRSHYYALAVGLLASQYESSF